MRVHPKKQRCGSSQEGESDMGDSHYANCTHRWVLGEPNISTVSGVCKNCGLRRTYPSTLGMRESTPDYAELDRSQTIHTIEIAALGERLTA